MDYLLHQSVAVTPVFGGNQEGIMAQLQAGKVTAAAVNSRLLQDYANREKLHYRVIWESGRFHNIPVAAHPRVPKDVVAAVRQAFVEMERNPEGFKILETSARLVGQEPPYGFRAASAADYRSYVEFYRATLLKDDR
jgi:phosphonate transport system substrate-binding protein